MFSATTDGSGMTPSRVHRRTRSQCSVTDSSLMPSPPSRVKTSSPFCLATTSSVVGKPRAEPWTVPPVFSVICWAICSYSSQVQVVSSGIGTPAASKTAGLAMIA
jgi:hypothetical protein